MPDNIDKYIPEFDEDEARAKLAGHTVQELTDMLIYCYKLRRVVVKEWEEATQKLSRIKTIIEEPSGMLGMPDIPTPDDLRKMFGEEE